MWKRKYKKESKSRINHAEGQIYSKVHKEHHIVKHTVQTLVS